MCYENGGVVDDLLVYKLDEDDYLLVVNAANIEKDVEWLQNHIEEDVNVKDVSRDYAYLPFKVQKRKILQKLVDNTDL